MSQQKITPFLWFDGDAEEAIAHYRSIFDDSRVLNEHRQPDGTLFTATFELAGCRFMAINGGPQFRFTEAISLFVSCETQEEVDDLWAKLTDGGEESRCGWLKDRYGLSWQIVPTALGRLLGSEDRAAAQRATEAFLAMRKIDIAALERAAAGG
jgi:predicted 3-demethylubiquinone-9 3-methyltransferase (glyoxalase superfamily)